MHQDQDNETGELEDDSFTFTFIADRLERPFWEGFEDPDPEWVIGKSVWQIGTPTAGPSSAYEGSSVAATILDGNYPGHTDSRLISPSIQLQEVVGAEETYLRFMQWFSYSSYDSGQVQISVWDTVKYS